MVVSTNQKGSLEFINTGEIFPYFQAFSNELYSPRVLTCPSDEGRKAATNFAMLRDRNLSYFLGLDSDETRPQTILSGDRNITTNGRLMSGIVTLTSNTVLKWTKDLHRDFGNIVLGDGSAQQVHNLSLNSQLYSTTNLTTRFAIP